MSQPVENEPRRSEIQRQAAYLARAMKKGLSPLWVVVAALVVVVGGNLIITFAWGVRHLIWGLIILLVVAFAVLAKGSYREHKRLEAQQAAAFAKRLAEQQTQHQAELDTQQKADEKDRASALAAQQEDYEKKLAAATKPVPQFRLSLYTEKPPEHGGWVTAHYLRASNPPGQPEYRVNIYLETMDPREPRYTPPPPYEAKPHLGHPVPPKGADRTAPSVLIGPGQEKSWLLGYTSIDDSGEKMYVSRFFSDRDISWEINPGESWRLSYRITCGSPMPEVQFAIVIEPEDGKLIVRLD